MSEEAQTMPPRAGLAAGEGAVDRRGKGPSLAFGVASTLDELVARLDAHFGSAPLASMFGAQRAAKRKEAASLAKCLVFQLNRTRFAFRMDNVLEVQPPPSGTPIPNVPPWLLGVTNLRGEIVSVLDLRGFLAMEAAGADVERRFVVARSAKQDLCAGMLVDRVEGIRGLPLDRLAPASIDLPPRLAPFAVGLLTHDGGLLVVLDAEKLLLSPEMRQFEPA